MLPPTPCLRRHLLHAVLLRESLQHAAPEDVLVGLLRGEALRLQKIAERSAAPTDSALNSRPIVLIITL